MCVFVCCVGGGGVCVGWLWLLCLSVLYVCVVVCGVFWGLLWLCVCVWCVCVCECVCVGGGDLVINMLDSTVGESDSKSPCLHV